ncbi:MAG: methyltransferase domain-containing protein, partial [Ferruginibacter sp.]
HFNPAFNKSITKSTLDKLKILKIEPESIFPYSSYISKDIDIKKFSLSFLQQPDLFLRIRPGKKYQVIKKLEDSTIDFKAEKDWIRLGNSEKIDTLISLNKEAVVQDINSQKVFNFFEKFESKKEFNVWDCCAASGGKSILLYDRLKGKIKITASDVRTSILENLKIRFHKAGINIKKLFVANLLKPFSIEDKFDIIICDAPCTGSGTWARTPEQLYLFKKESIADYTQLQRKIIDNSMPALKPGGYFCYITCSVFADENEEIVKYISGKYEVENVTNNYLKGYESKADTLFVSIFKSAS